MDINTPQGITESFPDTLFAVNAKNKFKLIQDLRSFEQANSVFPFGEYVHFTSTNKDLKLNDLKNY